MTRTNSIIYKNYIEIKDRWPNQRGGRDDFGLPNTKSRIGMNNYL
jgi:hypothetical protein